MQGLTFTISHRCQQNMMNRNHLWRPVYLSSAAIFIYCLFSFKFSIFGDTRIDDLLVVVLCAIAFWFFLITKKGRIQTFSTVAVLSFLLFSIISLFSSLYNLAVGRVNPVQSILFSIRHLEYFIFIFLGYILSYYQFNFSFWLKTYLIFVLAIIPLQAFDIAPVFSGFSPDRAIANAGGPWEMAAIAAFLFFYFLENRYFFFIASSFVVLVLTASRVTLAATLLSLLTNLNRTLSPPIAIALCLSCGLTVVTAGIFFSTLLGDSPSDPAFEYGVINRIISFFSYETFISVSNTISSTSAVNTSEDFLTLTLNEKIGIALEDLEGDHSAVVRFSNWAILLKSAFFSFDSLVLGLGPSFAGKAVDGGFVRLFIETGFLGLAAYFSFIISVLTFSRSRLLFNYFLTLVLSAIFIDIFTTYKAMFLFWVFYGRELHIKDAARRNVLISSEPVK